jgi:hypothetical protein
VILSEVSREASELDEKTFCARFPEPALVFLALLRSFDGISSELYTPNDPKFEAYMRTSQLKATVVFRAQALLQGTWPRDEEGAKNEFKFLAISPVHFLKKTQLNPFPNMITVGRAENNDVCLPLPSISKMHAYFMGSQTWRVFDQRSTNGTFMDSTPLAKGESAVVNDGCLLGFGADALAKFFLPKSLYAFVRSTSFTG